MVFRTYGPINLCFAEQTRISQQYHQPQKVMKNRFFLRDLTAKSQVFKFLDADVNMVFNICPSQSITRPWLIIDGIQKVEIFTL
jgi:hypothetical protein